MENSKDVNKETIGILNDLIQIHNDRMQGYEKAARELHQDNEDLRELFNMMITESRKMKSSLVNEVQVLHGEAEQGTTTSGKIYRMWVDVKSMFSGHDRHGLLSNCEYGEDATQKAYRESLESDFLPIYIRQLLYEQRQSLKTSHDEIKELRDQYA
jgi:uncharacterized protein (TIGR02284 family)